MKKKNKDPLLIPCPKCKGKGVLIITTYASKYYDRYCIWENGEVILDKRENVSKESEHELTCTTCGSIQEIKEMKKLLKRLTEYSNKIGEDKLLEEEPERPDFELVERPKNVIEQSSS